MKSTRRFALLAAASLAAAACDQTEQHSSVTAPQASLAATANITVRVYGPNGEHACTAVPGATFRIQLYNPGNNAVVRTQFPSCPATVGATTPPLSSTFSGLTTGLVYDASITISAAPSWFDYPRRYFERVGLLTANATLDTRLQHGILFGGLVTFDGVPVEGARFGLTWPDYTGQTTSLFGSGADGRWTEFGTNRTGLYLRPDRYRFNASCDALNARAIDPLFGNYLFPTEVSGYDCQMVSGQADDYSHTSTALVLTPGAGELGGLDEHFVTNFGTGWGVQYPVVAPGRPKNLPYNASHLFSSALMIGLEDSGTILSTPTLRHYMHCDGTCEDLGGGAHVSATARNGHGRKVTWTFDDSGSPNAVGLHITQTSFDGKAPHDYVLVNYSFHNKGDRTQTFYAGKMYDWDIDEIGTTPSEAGGSEYNGKLMYNVGRAGTHMGTLIAGDFPLVGAHHFSITNLATSLTPGQQLQIMRGQLRALSTGNADARYIQTIGPITVRKGHKAELWIAVVGGRSKAELVANAQAAEADIGEKRRGPVAGEPAGVARSHTLRKASVARAAKAQAEE